MKALLDSESLITLVHASLMDPAKLGSDHMGVLCVHGNANVYPIAVLTVKMPSGTVKHFTGVVKNLLHRVILFQLFWILGLPVIILNVLRQGSATVLYMLMLTWKFAFRCP